MPRWITSCAPPSRPAMMYFPRRRKLSIFRPAIESTNSSGSGWRTRDGKRRSHWTMVRPTRCGRRSATMVSTSGSSGINSPPRSAGRWRAAPEGPTKLGSCPYQRQLAHVGPIRAYLRLHLDPGLELIGAGHDARYRLGETIELSLGNLEQQLVVDLKQHATFDVVGLDLTL